MTTPSNLREKLAALWPLPDERTRRLCAANEAKILGYGGVSKVHRACGLSRKAITLGLRELRAGIRLPEGRIRRTGAGRKRITTTDPNLSSVLEQMIEPETRGDPESPLRWICKSTRVLAAHLTRRHHPISYVKVGQLLREQGFSLQSNRKVEEGGGVYAVDVGYGQLHARLRTDPRVVLLEKVNARSLSRREVPEPVGLFVADVSFISLTMILPAAVPLLAPLAEAVLLVKAQYESARGEVGKRGIVRDPEVRKRALGRVAAAAASLGLSPARDAPVADPGRRRERGVPGRISSRGQGRFALNSPA